MRISSIFIGIVILVAAIFTIWYFAAWSYSLSRFPVGSIVVENTNWNVYIAYDQALQQEGSMQQPVRATVAAGAIALACFFQRMQQ